MGTGTNDVRIFRGSPVEGDASSPTIVYRATIKGRADLPPFDLIGEGGRGGLRSWSTWSDGTRLAGPAQHIQELAHPTLRKLTPAPAPQAQAVSLWGRPQSSGSLTLASGQVVRLVVTLSLVTDDPS